MQSLFSHRKRREGGIHLNTGGDVSNIRGVQREEGVCVQGYAGLYLTGRFALRRLCSVYQLGL